MAASPIPAACACAQSASAPLRAMPARTAYEMLSDAEHTADTISALAKAAELAIYEVKRKAAADITLWLDRELSDTHKLLRLIRREALALAEVISDIELSTRPPLAA